MAQTQRQLTQCGIALDVNIFVLDVATQSLDKDVVKSPPAPVHVDSDTFSFEHANEVCTGELRAGSLLK